MATNIIITGEEAKKKEDEKKQPPRRNRRRGSGKNKKKIEQDAVKKFKEDSSKKQKAVFKNLTLLGVFGLPAGWLFWLLLQKLVYMVTALAIAWATYMASLLK